jgi:glyoxylase-like metal-dependent hydrolase (beta-lactamase superfamily II)
MPDHQYHVYAVRYAHRDDVPAWEAFHTGPHAAPAKGMEYFVWAVADGQRAVVVDTGFTAPVGARRGRTFLRSPDRGLAHLGIDAGQVDHVILTHCHYDHIGNLALFPRATFWIQEREMCFYTGPDGVRPAFRASIEADDICALVRLNYEGRLRFLDGDAVIIPGVSAHFVGGHTAGMQIVSAETPRGRAVLASDAAHYYANLEEGNPFNTLHDVARVYRGYDRIRELASAPELILPGHDPLVFDRLRLVDDGIVEL